MQFLEREAIISFVRCLPIRLLTKDDELIGTFTFSDAPIPHVFIEETSLNEYIACYYDSNWWIGLIQEINQEERDVKINFMHPSVPSKSFTWPDRRNTCWVSNLNIFLKLKPPTTTTGRTSYVEKKDYEQILKTTKL